MKGTNSRPGKARMFTDRHVLGLLNRCGQMQHQETGVIGVLTLAAAPEGGLGATAKRPSCV